MGIESIRMDPRRKNPNWSRHLAVDGKSYLKKGLRYLEETRDTAFRVEPPQE
jgi:hypothetical protein